MSVGTKFTDNRASVYFDVLTYPIGFYYPAGDPPAYGNGASDIEWNFSYGGFGYQYLFFSGGYSGYLNYLSPPQYANGSTPLPASGFLNVTWENNSQSQADIGPAGSSDSSYLTQTHVMIQPAGQQTVGQTTLYLLQAQVINEATGLQLPAALVQFMNQLAGTTTEDVTNDDGSVWTTAMVSAPAGTNIEVTPTTLGNISFNGMQVFKSKEAWQQDVRNEIYSDTGGAADMNTYNPANGFMNNRVNLQAVYAFYQKLFGENANLLWAGLGKLAGAPVYAGLSDAQYGISFGFFTNDLTTFQNTLITMNTNILQDLAWQSEAYYKGGLNALNVIYAGETNALDLPTINAWREIDDGIQNDDDGEIHDGNLQLAHREQFTILQPDYDILNGMGGITNVISILAQNPVPTGTNFTAVVPGGNLCVFNDRWNWITNSAGGIWPNWVATDPTTQSGWVNIPLKTRAANYTLLPLFLYPIQ
jgi:hypothetical protein